MKELEESAEESGEVFSCECALGGLAGRLRHGRLLWQPARVLEGAVGCVSVVALFHLGSAS